MVAFTIEAGGRCVGPQNPGGDRLRGRALRDTSAVQPFLAFRAGVLRGRRSRALWLGRVQEREKALCSV